MRYAILLGLALLATAAWADFPPVQESCPAVTELASCGADIDMAYARMACAINAQITALSASASARADDNCLRAYAAGLVAQQASLVVPVRDYVAGVCGGDSAGAGCGPCPMEDPLATLTGSQFNQAYVSVTLALLHRSLEASTKAAVCASDCRIRAAAMANARAASDTISRFEYWQETSFLSEQQLERFCGMHPSSTRCPQ